MLRVDLGDLHSPEQYTFGRHWDSGEMTTAVTKRFPNYRQWRFSHPITKIGA
jgi:hypothetical protein